MNKEDKPVVLVTGAAGGLGQGIAQEFVRQNWSVAAGWHRRAIDISLLPSAVQVPLDVCRADSVDAAVRGVIHVCGRLDALVNCAGAVADGLLSRMDSTAWQRVIDVNLKGCFLCSKAALPWFPAETGGSIVNIGSFSARWGAAGQANYAAAKAAVLGLTSSLAREVGGRNVRVNAVLPGVLRTRMTAALTEEQLASFAGMNSLGRINDIDEVARFVVFLATLRNVSGQVFQLDSRIAAWT